MDLKHAVLQQATAEVHTLNWLSQKCSMMLNGSLKRAENTLWHIWWIILSYISIHFSQHIPVNMPTYAVLQPRWVILNHRRFSLSLFHAPNAVSRFSALNIIEQWYWPVLTSVVKVHIDPEWGMPLSTSTVCSLSALCHEGNEVKLGSNVFQGFVCDRIPH